MNKEQGFTPERQQLKISVRENGDVYLISGLSAEQLLDVAIKVSEKLSRSPLSKDTIEYLKSGDELRPGGCFAVSVKRGELWIDNRNGRGVKQFTEELKEAVEFATN